MVGQVINLITGVLTACVGWFETALSSVGGTALLIAVVSMALAYKFLLAPVLGDKGSDTADERGGE